MRIRHSLALALALAFGVITAARADEATEESSYEDVVKEKCKEFVSTYNKITDDEVNALVTGLSDLYKKGDPVEHEKERKTLIQSIARATTLRSDPMVKRAIELLGETDEDAMPFLDRALTGALKAKPMKSEIYEACFVSLGKLASPKSIKLLTGYLKHKESDVIAHAANALKGFKDASGKVRKEIFEELLKMSEGVASNAAADASSPAAKRWNVFGPSVVDAMKELSRQDRPDPRAFREWFNDNKKANWDEIASGG